MKEATSKMCSGSKNVLNYFAVTLQLLKRGPRYIGRKVFGPVLPFETALHYVCLNIFTLYKFYTRQQIMMNLQI